MTKIYINDFETITRSNFVVDATKQTSKQKFKADFESVEIGQGVYHIVTDKAIVYNDMVYNKGNYIEKRFENNTKTHKLYFKNGEYYWYNRTITASPRYEFNEEDDSKYLIDPYQDCFYGCSTIKSVYIGNSVQDIGLATFAKCSNIEYIYYNTNAKFEMFNANDYSVFKNSGKSSLNGIELEIGNESLQVPCLFGTPDVSSSASLTKVIFEDNSKCGTINEMAFYNSRIQEITLPESLSTIKGSSASVAFYGCSSLKTIKWYGNSITCGGNTYSSKNQDTSTSGLTAFQNYMRAGGTHSSATDVVVELISR